MELYFVVVAKTSSDILKVVYTMAFLKVKVSIYQICNKNLSSLEISSKINILFGKPPFLQFVKFMVAVFLMLHWNSNSHVFQTLLVC